MKPPDKNGKPVERQSDGQTETTKKNELQQSRLSQAGFRIPSARERWANWLASNPCPADEPGAPTVNDWIFAAARACQWRAIPIDFGIAQTEAQIPESRHRKKRSEVERTFRKVYGQPITGSRGTSRRPHKADHDPFNADSLAAVIDSSIADPIQYLCDRSPMSIDVRPSDYLRAITRPGEIVAVMPHAEAYGSEVKIWKHTDHETRASIDARVDQFADSSRTGAFFLTCPVDGVERDGSYRRIPNVTSWRHAILECDCEELGIDPLDWLRLLIAVPLPIVSIIHSGGRGAHALIRTGTETYEELRGYIEEVLRPYTLYGADGGVMPNGEKKGNGAMTAHRLTRLANCWRGEKRQRQTLFYLNPQADGTPICDVSAQGNTPQAEFNRNWAEWCARQGFAEQQAIRFIRGLRTVAESPQIKKLTIQLNGN